MKFKKMLTVLFTSVLLLTFSSPAGAVTGLGDTKASAITLIPLTEYNLFISNSTDQDWYSWKNNTGGAVYASGFLNQGNVNHRVGFMIKYADGFETDMLYAMSKPHHSIHWNGFIIPNGATVYLVVEQMGEFKMYEGYQLVFINYPVD